MKIRLNLIKLYLPLDTSFPVAPVCEQLGWHCALFSEMLSPLNCWLMVELFDLSSLNIHRCFSVLCDKVMPTSWIIPYFLRHYTWNFVLSGILVSYRLYSPTLSSPSIIPLPSNHTLSTKNFKVECAVEPCSPSKRLLSLFLWHEVARTVASPLRWDVSI